MRGAAAAHVRWLTTPHDFTNWTEVETFVVPWTMMFVFQWVAFLSYMALDYKLFKAKTLYTGKDKLPTRHPLIPFWRSQLKMVPGVLFNQCVVWPLVSFLLIWPIWARTNTSSLQAPLGGWPVSKLIPTFLVLMFLSDYFWYWCHRFLHVRSLLGIRVWQHCHRDHHLAEQCALSATYVHPVEYALFTIAMQFFFAITGFPLYLHAIPCAWGMFTGSGAHSGYSGTLANGDEHNAHHVFHNVNFGLLMMADRLHGTHWNPADPLPPVWEGASEVPKEFPELYGSFEASTYRTPQALAERARIAEEKKGTGKKLKGG